jgi:hypothetical protein
LAQFPETYFSRRAKESHAAMISAADSGSRLAHAQLKAAYQALDRSESLRTAA